MSAVPIGWTTTKVKYLAEYLNGYPFAPAEWSDKGKPIIRIQNLTDQEAGWNRTESVVPQRYCVEPGDILISWSASLGVHVWEKESALLNQHIFKVTPAEKVHRKFYLWAAKWFIGELESQAHGSTMQHLTRDVFGGFKVPVPPVELQERIANFLDEKTARIDALIAEKERLLERLHELRYSVVSWAVTGGLHAAGGLVETGNPFVPKVPKSWSFGGLTKYIGPVVDYRGKTPEKVEDGVLLVTARNIRDGELNYDASAEYVRAEDYAEIMRRGAPRIGDVLFTMEAPLGEVANVDREDIALAQRVVKFRGLPGVLNNYFLKYWLMGDAAQSTLSTLATGSTAEGIKASKLGQIPLAVPSPKEQQEIVEYLDIRRKAIDGVLAHALEHIDRLREYRSSLISAAVTGQLDIGAFEEAA